MVSQPLVAGWLAGAIVGEPMIGLGVGLLLQVVWGRAYALGGASFPVVGPAAVVAAGVAAPAAARATSWGALRVPDVAVLSVALLAAFATAEAGRLLVLWKRRHRRFLLDRALAAAAEGSAAGVVRVNAIGVAQGALMGVVLAAGGLSLGWGLLPFAQRVPAIDGRWVALAVFGVGLGHTATLVERRGRGLAWLAVTLAGAGAGWVLR